VKSNLPGVIQFIKSLPATDLLRVTEGEQQISFVDNKLQLIDSEIECSCLLFSGGENWLDSHVPDCDRGTEAVRVYVIDYVRGMYKYIVEDWNLD